MDNDNSAASPWSSETSIVEATRVAREENKIQIRFGHASQKQTREGRS